jgi:hypothetical protein
MRQAQDIVWNIITESAKLRFDYIGFRKSLSERGDDERTAEYIVFQVVVGYAEGLSDPEVLSKVRSDLLLFGCPLSDGQLGAFLADKRKVLKAEIRAAEAALSGFEQGRDAEAVLVQVRRLLG